MEPYNPSVNEIVMIRRTDCDGDRIPYTYRMYVSEREYMYKARVITLCANKNYNRVQPLPWTVGETPMTNFTRKGYKTKTFRLD
jgi:hypothetical protein